MAAIEYAESLLQKDDYVEGCPGCAVDRRKQLQRGLPLKQILTVWMIVLATGNQTLPVCVCVQNSETFAIVVFLIIYFIFCFVFLISIFCVNSSAWVVVWIKESACVWIMSTQTFAAWSWTLE